MAWHLPFTKATKVYPKGSTGSTKNVLSLMQLLFVLWQLLLNAVSFSSQPQLQLFQPMSCAKWIESILNTISFSGLSCINGWCSPLWCILSFTLRLHIVTPRVRTLRISTLSAINTSRAINISQGHKPSKKHGFHHLEHRSTTAAQRHLHFLLGMLALVTLGLRSLLRFNPL